MAGAAEANNDNAGDVRDRPDETCFHLMELPVELRLQIYGWLHLMSPVLHPQLAPWYPTPRNCAYFVRPVSPMIREASIGGEHRREKIKGVSDEAELINECAFTDVEVIEGVDPDTWEFEVKTQVDLLSPFRSLSALPSAFLRANKQIYHESRSIPFEENEFVFVNWFSSGLWAASIFTKRLQPWQGRHLRFVRLEVMYGDFEGPGLERWEELCSDWAKGVFGLRMKVAIGGALKKKDGGHVSEAEMTRRKREMAKCIGDGLGRISRLEKVELELATEDMDDLEKVKWCYKLQGSLKEKGLNVKVTCIEKTNGEAWECGG